MKRRVTQGTPSSEIILLRQNRETYKVNAKVFHLVEAFHGQEVDLGHSQLEDNITGQDRDILRQTKKLSYWYRAARHT
jgi:hypothetical protein